MLTLVLRAVGVLGVAITGLLLWRAMQAWLWTRAQKHSVETAARTGGTVYLPNGHHIEFRQRPDVKAIPTPQPEPVAPRERARSGKRR